ncbi:MAG: 50S ribosomal protein L29 [Gammaproteobacteria bacterium]
MKLKEEREQFRAMKPSEMQRRIEQLREEQFKLRVQKATGQLTQTARLKNLRGQIARIKTLLREQAN